MPNSNFFKENIDSISIPDTLPPSPTPLPVSAILNQQQLNIQAQNQLTPATIEAPNSGTSSFNSSQVGLQQQQTQQRSYTSTLNKIANQPQHQFPAQQQHQVYQNQTLPMEQRTQQMQQQMQLQQQYQQQQRILSGGKLFFHKKFN